VGALSGEDVPEGQFHWLTVSGRGLDEVPVGENLPEVHHACFEGRGSGLSLQMCHERFGWRLVA